MEQTTRFVYADNAATTPVAKEVLDAMLPYLTEEYGNPNSIYSLAWRSHAAIDAAREQVAKALNAAKPREIFFTGGGSEGDNWAIKGVAEAYEKKGRHIISTKIEHHAVLHTLEYLEKKGWEVTYLDVDEYGLVTPGQVEQAIRPDTTLITVMYANNEIGTVEPIAEIGAVAKKHGVLFHTDAVQAVGNVPIDVQAQNIDLLSLSGHKLHGPKGIGALYVRSGVRVMNLIHGGAQEMGRRAGTENTAGIVGLGKAIEMATTGLEERAARLAKMRDRIIAGALQIPHTRLNGHPEKRLPGNTNVSIEFIEGESIILTLGLNGIAASSGSACTSGSLDPSHVLLAIGLPHAIAHGSLRLTLSDQNTDEDVDYILEKLPQVVERLRAMSPLYEEFLASQAQ